MKSLVKKAQSFERLDIPLQDLPWTEGWKKPQNVQAIVLEFSAEGRHLAEDYFDCEELEPDGKGGYTVKVAYAENNWLYGFLLSFGTVVEVLEPEPVRRRLAGLAAEIAAKYKLL
ncbi:hypothetical protein D3C85_1355640 [compost metagenome]